MVLFSPTATLSSETGLCFFILYRNITLGKYTPIYKSEIKRPEMGSFRWNLVQMGTSDLCKDDIEREIKVEFFRSVPSGKHKIIDSCTFNLAQLREGTIKYDLEKKRGTFEMINLKIEKKRSFLEYIFGGCEVDFSIAIDFTLSNGDPRQNNSLHSSNMQINQYLQAINSVGNIL